MTKQILVIEPDYILANTYKMYLETKGFFVDLACNAQTAIMVADSRFPDAVIMEMQLVEHSGMEFLYEFRSYVEWQQIPIIINSFVPPNEFASSWGILKEQLNIKKYLYKPQTRLRDLESCLNELSLQIA
jgi:CheY-like chemotaxis protein